MTIGTMGLVIVVVCLLGLGIACLIQAVQELSCGARSRAWPTVTGLIADARISEDVSDSGPPSYWAQVEYEYMLEGRHYLGETIAFGQITTELGDAQQLLGRFRPGTPVTVYYDPRNVRRVVLHPGVSWRGGIVSALLGVLLLGLSIAALAALVWLLEGV